MNKSTYLIITGLLSFDYLTNNFTRFITSDLYLVATMLWALFGFFYYKGYSPLYTKKNQIYIYLFFILIFLSQLSPLFKYNQDLISTIIANRLEYSFIFMLVLFKIGPTEEDIFHAFKVLGIITLAFSIIVFFCPQWFVDIRRLKGFLRYQDRGGYDLLVVWPGAKAAVYYFYILIYKTVTTKAESQKYLFWATIFMIYIFAIQNRSTLIMAAPSYLYVLMKAQTKYKWIIITIIVAIAGIYIINVFSALIEESQSQLGDKHYNRWQAVEYYLFERSYGFYDTLLGNGRPSAGSVYLYELVRASKTRLAIISDIGLLGTFFFYGLAMMLFIYRFVLAAILRRNMPLYLRLYALWVLLVPTIHNFGTGTTCSGMIMFSIFFYNILLYEDRCGRVDNYS